MGTPATTVRHASHSSACAVFVIAACASADHASADEGARPGTRHAQGAERDGGYAHTYEHAPGIWGATEIHPGDRSGFALAAGIGNSFAGLGAQVSHYFLMRPGLLLVPFGSVGVARPWEPHLLPGAVLGVMGMLGTDDHWLTSVSYGFSTEMRRASDGDGEREREIRHIVALDLGHEWMANNGGFFRILAGALWYPEPDLNTLHVIYLGFGGGWKG